MYPVRILSKFVILILFQILFQSVTFAKIPDNAVGGILVADDGSPLENDPWFGSVPAGDHSGSEISTGVGLCARCLNNPNCNDPVRVHNISIAEPGILKAYSIVHDGCSGTTVQIGSCCSVTIRFAPLRIGSYAASEIVQWSSNAHSGTSSRPLTGESVSYSALPNHTVNNSTNVCSNSSINMDTLALHETIPIVGVPFDLDYSSDRLRPTSSYSPKPIGLGGWMPSILHHYDFANRFLFLGNGNHQYVSSAIQSNTGYLISSGAGDEIYYFDKQGRHLRTLNALTGIAKYNFLYTTQGKISQITDQYSNIINFTYSTRKILIQSAQNQTTEINLDSKGFLATAKNPNNEIYTVTNNSVGYIVNFEKPAGQKSTVTYDNQGFVTKDVGAGGDLLNLLRQFDQTSGQQIVTVSTALNRITTYKTMPSDVGSVHLTTEPSGQISTVTNQQDDSNKTTDGYGNIHTTLQQADPRFGWMSAYNSSSVLQIPNSNVQIINSKTISTDLTDSNDPFSFSTITKFEKLQNDPSKIFTSVYQKNEKLLTSYSPLNRSSKINLNELGQISKFQNGNLLPVDFAYNSQGKLISTQQSDRKKIFTYDQYLNVSQITDSIGRNTAYEYDNANRVIKSILPDGKTISMTYDANGNMTSITPANKPAHNFSYNLFESVQEYLPPLLGISASQTTTYAYNLDKQITEINKPGGSKLILNYQNTNGLLNSVQTPNGSYVYTYANQSDLLSSVVSPDQQITNYQYAGSIPTVINNTGVITNTVNLSYFTDGYLSNMSVSGKSGSVGKNINFNYDKDGLLIQVGNEFFDLNSVGSPTNSKLGKITKSTTYNNFGEIENETVVFNKKQNIQKTKYTRDTLGQITNISKGDHFNNKNHSLSYVYDSQGRLTLVKDNRHVIREYKYDANGNRSEFIEDNKKIIALYDDQDRLIKYGNTEYKYSASGNLSEKIIHHGKKNHHDKNYFSSWFLNRDSDHKHKTEITRYSFDAVGNLKKVILSNGKKIEYIIDGQNRRVGKKVNGNLIQGFIYQTQTQISAELDGAGRITKQFIYGEKQNSPDYMIYQGKEYKFISDQVGTLNYVIESESGRWLSSMSMDEFGDNRKIHGSDVVPFGFAGGLYDADTELIHFGARDYDPKIGRWISKDPIGFNGGDTNLYAYVGGNPVSYVDPTGLAPGDPFRSEMEAAGDAINFINPTSINQNREYGGHIIQNANGTFAATMPIRGGPAGVQIGNPPRGATADYHTHGAFDPNYNNEDFSLGDFRDNARSGLNGYLGTPNGSILGNIGGNVKRGLTCPK